MELPEISKRKFIYSIPQLLDRGIILLDKPPRLTSHETSAFVKNILGISKAGHSGTLDPDVSGVLIVALNKATRFLEFLKDYDKEYVCLMRLYSKPGIPKIKTAMSKFVGIISQQVPLMAAVRRTIRKREIKSLHVLDWCENQLTTDVLFHAKVQSGTYIRVLCEDIGKSLGTKGKMLELRRTAVGPVSENNAPMCTLQELWRAFLIWKEKGDESLLRRYLIPIDTFSQFPSAVLKPTYIRRACCGAALYQDSFVSFPSHANCFNSKYISVFDNLGRLVCVAELTTSNKTTQIIAIPKKVFLSVESTKS